MSASPMPDRDDIWTIGRSHEGLIVKMTDRAPQALERATELTEDSKADIINRALQLESYLEQIEARGGSIHVREAPDSELGHDWYFLGGNPESDSE